MQWLTLQWQLLRPYARWVYYTLFPRRRPDYFRAPWTYPGAPMERACSSYLPVSSEPVFFFFPMNDWHARMQRSQHLANAIARSGGQAVYVNPHLGLEYLRPYGFDPHTRIAQLAPRLFELHIHLPREHELHQRALTAAENARLARELGRLIEAAGTRQAVIVAAFPAWLEAAADLRRRYAFPIVYDCHDWLPGFGRTPPALLEQEHALFRLADLVVFSSQLLRDRVLEHQTVGGECVLIRNAVEPFDDAAPAPAPRPGATKTIGYVGAFDHWFDIEAVAAVAQRHPRWRVVLAGRVEDRRILRLQRFPNVLFTGEIPHSAVASHLHEWDAAMIPFLVNDLTRATNPIKLYEYFGAGLPVVSTRLPEVELYGDLVYLADSPAGFAAAASAAMTEQNSARRERRVRTASRETWTARAEQLLECLGRLERPAPRVNGPRPQRP